MKLVPWKTLDIHTFKPCLYRFRFAKEDFNAFIVVDIGVCFRQGKDFMELELAFGLFSVTLELFSVDRPGFIKRAPGNQIRISIMPVVNVPEGGQIYRRRYQYGF